MRANEGYDRQLQLLVEAAFKEDLGSDPDEYAGEGVVGGDHSTLSCIPPDARGTAVLKIKQDGVIAGMEVAERILTMQEPGAIFRSFKEDGDPVRTGEQAFEAEASVHTLLRCERLILNCMQRMSGIATLTRQYVDRLEGYHTRVLDTRKATPNFRLLEKEAVRIGGGVNHRFGLFDMILLKDNHIDYCGSLEKAITMAGVYRRRLAERTGTPMLKIEVETRSLQEVERVMALAGSVDRIMLDNFSPEMISRALILTRGLVETEASGGINLENLEAYARTGVDFVSIGALIHQARSIDLSFKAVPAG